MVDIGNITIYDGAKLTGILQGWLKTCQGNEQKALFAKDSQVKATQEVGRYKKRVEELERELRDRDEGDEGVVEGLKKEVGELEGVVKGLKRDLVGRDEEVAKLKDRLLVQGDDVGRLERDLVRRQGQVYRLIKDLSVSKGDIKRLELEKKGIEKQGEVDFQKVKKLDEEVKRYELLRTKKNEEIKVKIEENGKLGVENDSLKLAVTRLQEACRQRTVLGAQQVEEVKVQLARSVAENTSLRKKVDDLSVEATVGGLATAKEIEAARVEWKKVDAERVLKVEEKEGVIRGMQDKLDAARKRESEWEEKILAGRKREEGQENKIRELEEELDQLKSDLNDARRILYADREITKRCIVNVGRCLAGKTEPDTYDIDEDSDQELDEDSAEDPDLKPDTGNEGDQDGTETTFNTVRQARLELIQAISSNNSYANSMLVWMRGGSTVLPRLRDITDEVLRKDLSKLESRADMVLAELKLSKNRCSALQAEHDELREAHKREFDATALRAKEEKRELVETHEKAISAGTALQASAEASLGVVQAELATLWTSHAQEIERLDSVIEELKEKLEDEAKAHLKASEKAVAARLKMTLMEEELVRWERLRARETEEQKSRAKITSEELQRKITTTILAEKDDLIAKVNRVLGGHSLSHSDIAKVCASRHVIRYGLTIIAIFTLAQTNLSLYDPCEWDYSEEDKAFHVCETGEK
jgi:chromosome segregation ATPase